MPLIHWNYGNSRCPAEYAIVFVLMLILTTACHEPGREGPDEHAAAQQPEATPMYDQHERNATPDPEVTRPEKEKGSQRTPPPSDLNDPIADSEDVTYGPPASPEEMVQEFGLFVTGRVVEVLPAQWTTPDGQRPENLREPGVVPQQYRIITPALIELDSAPVVNHYGADLAAGQHVVVAAFGGQVGEDSITTNNSAQRFTVGQRVLLGLSIHPYMQGNVEQRYETPAGLAWNVGTKYILTADGRALSPNPNEEPQSAEALIESLKAAADDYLDEARATPDPGVALPEKERGPLTTPPPRDSNDPITSGTEVTFGEPPSPEEIGRGESLVVTGEVIEILPAEWATPDGQRPEDPWKPGVVPEQYPIISPIVIALDAPPLVNRTEADLSSGEVVVAAYGGQVGEDRVWTNDPSQHFRMGKRVLVILTNRPYLQGGVEKRYETAAGLAWNAGLKYTLAESGAATPSNPNAERLPTSELIERIKTAAEAR